MKSNVILLVSILGLAACHKRDYNTATDTNAITGEKNNKVAMLWTSPISKNEACWYYNEIDPDAFGKTKSEFLNKYQLAIFKNSQAINKFAVSNDELSKTLNAGWWGTNMKRWKTDKEIIKPGLKNATFTAVAGTLVGAATFGISFGMAAQELMVDGASLGSVVAGNVYSVGVWTGMAAIPVSNLYALNEIRKMFTGTLRAEIPDQEVLDINAQPQVEGWKQIQALREAVRISTPTKTQCPSPQKAELAKN